MSSHPFLVVVSIKSNVEIVLRAEFLHHCVDVLHSAGAFSHGLCRVVGVATRSVPIGEELGGKRDVHIIVLGDATKKIARHPQVVTHIDSKTWSDLEFPLAWHDLSISPRNVNASDKACPVVHVGDDSTEADVCTDGAVVWSLRAWVTIGWPSEWPFCKLIGSTK